MSRKCLSLGFVMYAVLYSLCGRCFAEATAPVSEANDKVASAIDEAARTVVYLQVDQQASEVVDTNGVKTELDLYYRLPGGNTFCAKRTSVGGTGFLVESEAGLYVVTAKHVVKDNKSVGRYWISPIAGEIVTGTFEDQRVKVPGAKWFFHGSADVAIHPLVASSAGARLRVTRADKLLIDPPELLTQVCIPGFPHTLGKDNIRLGPLVATTEIASWPALPPQNNLDAKVIFLSHRLAEGYSGAPVYTLRDPPSRGPFSQHTMRLVGIVSGRYMFPVPIGSQGAVTQDELTYIVPVLHLHELLDSDEVKRFEHDLLARRGVKHAERARETASENEF